MSGRCIPEILRALKALQIADKTGMSTPANWVEGNPLIQASPQTYEELQKRQKEIEENRNGFSWYLSFSNSEKSEDVKQNRNVNSANEIKK